jgi:hypothetical protein
VYSVVKLLHFPLQINHGRQRRVDPTFKNRVGRSPLRDPLRERPPISLAFHTESPTFLSCKIKYRLICVTIRKDLNTMNTVTILQSKVASLPEPIAAEVLDFLEFLAAKKDFESKQLSTSIHQFRGSFKGRLSSSEEHANQKSDEVQLEG